MRIVAGAWRGRALASPPGTTTRPTSDRARQALFDMLMHAPWATDMQGQSVLDAFAGTGALGLEALSRGATQAAFFETAAPARAILAHNIRSLGAGPACTVLAASPTRPPPARFACGLCFLDPPYGQNLIPPAVTALRAAGWLTPDAILVAETARAEDPPFLGTLLAERPTGAARLTIWRA